MNALLPLSAVRLGAAAPGAAGPVAREEHGRWFAGWTAPDGIRVWSTSRLDAGEWLPPTPDSVRNETQDTPGAAPVLPAGVLARVEHAGGALVLRAGRRVPGVPPRFPGAGLVLAREETGGRCDLACTTDDPEAEILGAALAVHGDRVLAVYLAADGRGGVECRAARFCLTAAEPIEDSWRRLPDFPLAPGVAGVLAGRHDGVLIAAGGANFPGRPPWEGGVKKTYDDIFVLPPGASAWRPAGRLPAPRAYAAVVSVPEGLLVLGGENADGVCGDSLWLRWTGGDVAVTPAPALPRPVSSPVAAVLDGRVYVAGGYTAGPPRAGTAGFFCLDLADPAAGWRTLPAWPGPPRAQGVMAALAGAIYLLSGLELRAGADGSPQAVYLTDAHRYRPAGGWERLPDLPWSAIAAPSPAPVALAPAGVFVLGGVDGRQAGRLPRATRVPEDILFFDVARHAWRLWPQPWPEPVVTTPAVPGDEGWIFVSGETMAGQRTPAVLVWRPAARVS